MQTIVIIIIAIIILAALVILFFTQFGANKKNFGNFSEVGTSETSYVSQLANEGACVGTGNSISCNNFCEGTICSGSTYKVSSCSAVGCKERCVDYWTDGSACNSGSSNDSCIGSNHHFSDNIQPHCVAITGKVGGGEFSRSDCYSLGCRWE